MIFSRSTLDHVRHQVLHHVHVALENGVDDGVQDIAAHVLDGVERGHPGVVHDDVDAAVKEFQGFVDRRLDLGLIT